MSLREAGILAHTSPLGATSISARCALSTREVRRHIEYTPAMTNSG